MLDMKLQTVLADNVLLVIDASCVLCHWFWRFVIKNDRKEVCWFGALQDNHIQETLMQYAWYDRWVDSIWVIADGVLYQKSSAILRVLKEFPRRWQWTRVWYILPRVVRDGIYDRVAKNRIWRFGKKDHCDLSVTKEISKRLVVEQ